MGVRVLGGETRQRGLGRTAEGPGLEVAKDRTWFQPPASLKHCFGCKDLLNAAEKQ